MFNVEYQFYVIISAPQLRSFNITNSSNLAWIQNVEHRVGGGSGHKQNAVDGHRKATKCSVALPAVRPQTLNRHFHGEHNCDKGKKSDPHNEPSHPKTICGHQIQQIHRHRHAEATEDHTNLPPGRLKDAIAQDPSPLLDQLGTEPQHNHVDGH